MTGAELAAPGAPGLRDLLRESFFSLVVSFAALALDFGLLVTLTKYGHLNYLISAAAGFTAGAALNYGLSIVFVFRERRFENRWMEIAGFVAIGVIGLILNEGLMKFFVEDAGLGYALAKIPAAAMVFFFNYGARRVVLFTAAPASRDLAPSRDTSESVWLVRVVATLSIISAWLISRPYLGIVHDARIYVGRAIADLNPGGLGTELAFAHDGQSGFSLFPFLLREMVWLLGPAHAALSLTALGLACWVCAAAFLFSRFARKEMLWAILVCLAALPHGYGGFSIFEWAEGFITPRALSEAAGLLALAFLVDGRKLAALVTVLFSVGLHPLMGIPVAAAGLCMLVFEDRRWLAAAGAGLAAIVLGALLHVPVLQRLTAAFDPAWMQIISARTPYLFPQLWTSANYSLLLCQLLPVVLTVSTADSRLRRMLLSTIIVTFAGIAAVMLLPTQLIVQIQPWRAQWLLSVMAAASFPLAARALWQRERAGRVCLALLVLAWICHASLLATALCSLMVVSLRYFPQHWSLHRRAIPAVWVLVGAIAAAMIAVKCDALIQVLGAQPSPPPFTSMMARAGITAILVPAVAVAFTLSGFVSLPRPFWHATAILSLVAALFLLSTWDARTQANKMKEDRIGTQSLRAMLPGGSVLWLASDGTTWLLTGRPEWWSAVQGAGAVFNRQLASKWDRRFDALARAGLATPRQLTLMDEPATAVPLIQKSEAGMIKICARTSRPDWIIAPVAPVDGGIVASAVPKDVPIWTAPSIDYEPIAGKQWIAVRSYAVFSCARLSGVRTTAAPTRRPASLR